MLKFLKSKKFWLTVGHIAIIASGAYTSIAGGTAIPLVLSGVVNALMHSPAYSKGPMVEESAKS